MWWRSVWRTEKMDEEDVSKDFEELEAGRRTRSVTEEEVTPTAISRAEAAITVMALNCWLGASPKMVATTTPRSKVPVV